MRARATKLVLYTASNVSSIAQYGAIGALEGSQQCLADFKTELKARRDLFYAGLREVAPQVFSGNPPEGAFYAFVKINPDWAARDAPRSHRVAVVGGGRAPDQARAASAACPARTSGRRARATSASAPPAAAKS